MINLRIEDDTQGPGGGSLSFENWVGSPLISVTLEHYPNRENHDPPKYDDKEIIVLQFRREDLAQVARQLAQIRPDETH